MGIEQGPGIYEKPEVSQEKEYSQEELAKIGENVVARISEVKRDIEDFKKEKGKTSEWIENHKADEYNKEEVLATMEKKLKDIESFID